MPHTADLRSASPEPERRLVRDVARGQLGGVAQGLADHLRVNALILRAVFVVLAAWQLVGVAAYLALWLAIPPAREEASAPGVDAATRSGFRLQELAVPRTPRDAGQLLAFALVGAGALWTVQALGWGLSEDWLVPGLLASLATTLVWWEADRARGVLPAVGTDWRGWVRPALAHWTTLIAHVVALVALGAAIAWVALAVPGLGAVATTLLVLALVASGIALLVAPWLLRARRALVRAREEKMLSDARADMAAHLHDSVLQTLALIQRQSTDAQAVARLARRQERELRAWLYGGEDTADTLRPALREAALEVEDDFPVAVELVYVGEDVPLTPGLGGLVKAAREAMVNAAKHSGAPTVDVYAEVGERTVEVFVRDRGRGFVLEEVAEDRMGVRGSILERMARHHGTARLRSDPERGTEVSLEMER